MYVKYNNTISFEMIDSEIWIVIRALGYYINSRDFIEHYKQHGLDAFEKDNEHKIRLAFQFARSIGREDVIQNIVEDARREIGEKP